MSKLHPNVNCLWQKPRRGRINYADEVWFEPRTVGHNPLERFMKHFSEELDLNDKTYTNHCIRSTVLNTLGEHFEARRLIALSGHKSESSLRQYAVKYRES